jgi:L-ascorbate metabolism protein UlaG (beta-lactamase superfamily)
MNSLVNEIDKTQVEPGGLGIWWIGQEGFVFKSRGKIIYIDPTTSGFTL